MQLPNHVGCDVRRFPLHLPREDQDRFCVLHQLLQHVVSDNIEFSSAMLKTALENGHLSVNKLFLYLVSCSLLI
jgi:hypothetical protein